MNIHKLTGEEAKEINTWQYEEPYSLYNFSGSEETIEELLDGTYYGCCNEYGELIGYFCFGENAQVPGGRDAKLYIGEDTVDIGLGMKPHLTGQGMGKSFLKVGFQFALKAFQPKRIRLSVAAFNKRAITLYENVGFQKNVLFMSRGREFLLMEYDLDECRC
ncbi:N-acetyltransferase [Bacillus cereus]|uniref:GNAT family N-acetyltransferase n=1 Tax=Bacillus arachidis TaxID=2819290 RepID=A0ABS3NS09_9BACI|nr:MULTISPECIES: GNAT family protein [Bacillus]MBO1623712.1 GNAT family N-acetyltransferase [Bacillus arachidis]PFE04810.1 N-acetyltransferase [Bacillus sp. AFS023182]PGX96021.1 N-acetyltransferase [Bacillus cereus]SDZ31060.1 Acetyltransferase (GNAT) family protein [Bacillus sp. 166amftsu]